MILHDYESNSGRNLILEYIHSLTEREIVDAYLVRECMENGEFEKIQYKLWQKKIYEVYFYKHNRMFYVVPDGENIYLLHVCKKQKNKTEKADVKIIKKRAKELEKILVKKLI